MATKEEVLEYIKAAAGQNTISMDEIQQAFVSGGGHQHIETVKVAENSGFNQVSDVQPAKKDSSSNKRLSISAVLSYIGGAIVFLGIAILIAQNWLTLGVFTKVLATLGSGVAAYTVGIIFMKDKRTEPISNAFYLISALVIPIGLAVVIDSAGLDIGTYAVQLAISTVLFLMYLATYLAIRRNIFLLFSVIFGTWLFFSLTSFLVGSGSYLDTWQFYQYRFIVTGVSYLSLGYSFSKNTLAPMSNFLYGFGVFILLVAALILGGWTPEQNIFWELVYPIMVFGILYASVSLKNNSFLLWGSIFLMVYILKITSEYFTSGLGWSLSLVIAGLSMIGVGYMSFNLKNKYLTK